MGDVRATDLPASRFDECAPPVAQARRNALAQQHSTLESQRDANELAIAQPVTLPSDGESHMLAIASQSLPATLKRRTTPRTNADVYVLATAGRPSASGRPARCRPTRTAIWWVAATGIRPTANGSRSRWARTT